MDGLDLTRTAKPSEITLDPSWRLHAVKLSVMRGMAGRARMVSLIRNEDNLPAFGQYEVPSASGATPHVIIVDLMEESAYCDCMAHLHQQPCGHIGAVLLLVAGLCPPDERKDQLDAK